ncbi:MAG: hypothetical protein IJK62_09430, partial [Bacteroidales bacterium]|nr:hypothetical protein [Bacteroidales bacterium]
RILNYTLTGSKLEDGQTTAMNLSRRYLYANASKPHAPTSIIPTNNNALGSQLYQWDANGNFCGISNPRVSSSRRAYSNEENRMSAIYDDDGIMTTHPLGMQRTGAGAVYLYDADGERVWKFAGQSVIVYNSGNIVYSSLYMDKTFYPTPQTTFDKQTFYKHYYIGSERICTQTGKFTQTGNGPHSVGFIHGSSRSFIVGFNDMIFHSLDSVGYPGNFSIDSNFNCITTATNLRTKKYYYHYNHQGSVALVTYQNGSLQQHLQYLPYGGTFVDHRTGSYSSTYTFSAKEKDSESDYTYFGARYYSDNIMQWLSVDPMSDMRPGVSPYSYCQNNPIGRVDTWGMLDDEWEVDKDGCISWLNANKHYDSNGNEVDVLYSSDRNSSIEVPKEFMGSEEVVGTQIYDKEKDVYVEKDVHLHSVTGDVKAKEIFEFMSRNTDVEWGNTRVDSEESQNNFISTTREPSNNRGLGLLMSRGYNIRGSSHNHFKSSVPSGSDFITAEKVHQTFPSAKLFIYFGGKYYEYNQYGNFEPCK